MEVATIITNKRTASVLDYRGGSLTLRRRDDELEASFVLRVHVALAALHRARVARQEGQAELELSLLGFLAGMVRGGSPYH